MTQHRLYAGYVCLIKRRVDMEYRTDIHGPFATIGRAMEYGHAALRDYPNERVSLTIDQLIIPHYVHVLIDEE